MKTNKVFSSSSVSSKKYQIIGLKGNDHCRCFDENKFGILKNGLGLENNHVKKCFFSDNTVFRCKNYLIKFFNNKFGGVWTDKRRRVEWNWSHHPEYLHYIDQTKDWMKRVNNATQFDNHPELSKWIKTLSFDDQAIVISYWLIINW